MKLAEYEWAWKMDFCKKNGWSPGNDLLWNLAQKFYERSRDN